MIRDTDWHSFTERFPTLLTGKLSERRLRNSGVVREVGAGDVLYRDGDECTHLPLVIAGELLLTKHAENGRAITLYRVAGGESCILSALSILNAEPFPAEAISKNTSTLLLVPAEVLRDLISHDDRWRDLVFSTYHRRLSGLIALIEEVVFRKLDVRLAELLLARTGGESEALIATHQELAEELGSSREVVSRLLKEWERQDILSLRRGHISISHPENLRRIERLRD